MADLKTNYVDDVLDTTKNQLRKYQQIQNDDGTVSFVDVTEYTQVGTSFGAKDINDTNAAINYVNGKLATNLCEKNILVNERIKSACTIKIPDYKSYKFLMVIIKGDGNNGISICIPTIMMYTSDSGIPFSLYSTNGSIAISQSGYTIVAQGEVVTGNVKVSYLNIAQWNQAQVIVYGIN